MFLLSFLFRQGQPRPSASSTSSTTSLPKLRENLSHEEDESLCCSVDSNPVNMYKTHKFQQRSTTEQCDAEGIMEDFSTFMQKAAMSVTSVPGQEATTSIGSSSLQKDYYENKEDLDEWEDLPSPLPNKNSPPSTPQKNRVHFASEESPQSLLDYRDPDENCNETELPTQGNFQRRFQVDPIHEDSPFEEFPHNSFQKFMQDAPIRPPEEETSVRRCFENVAFVSPEYFDTLIEATEKEKRKEAQGNQSRHANDSFESISSSLSAMVCAMDPHLFVETPEEKMRREERSIISVSQASHYSGSSFTQTSSLDSVLHLDEYTIQPPKSGKQNRFERIRKKLSSSFLSKSKNTRVTYSLSKGLKGMSNKELVYSKSLLPAKPLLSAQQRRESSTSMPIPRSMPTFFHDRPLSILLLNPILKIFEIVLVDILRDTTVGDALSKARASATDSDLSEQKYISLCNRKQELAAPMLPVSLLLPSRKSRRKHRAKLSDADRCTEKQQNDEDKRRDMENRLLVAVPKGSTAHDCQKIRRILWKNPRIQRWWKQSDPFSRPSTNCAEEDSIIDNENVYAEPAPEATKKPRKEKRSKVRYQKL